MLPFTPRRRDNLASWMVARSDGEHYGKLQVFQFPKQKLVFGPQQVVARINQDQVISPQITLWNQQGSRGDPGHADGDSDRGVADLRAAALPARAGGPHSRADARHRRLPEPHRHGADARPGDGDALVRRRRSRGDAPAATTAATADRAAGRRRRGRQPPIDAVGWERLAAEARDTYQRALDAQRAGDWAKYGEEIKRLGELLSACASQQSTGAWSACTALCRPVLDLARLTCTARRV